jgi:glycosyltransferase involved in cell wall biosynthesis
MAQTLTVVLLAGVVFGMNTMFWALAGIVRYLSERNQRPLGPPGQGQHRSAAAPHGRRGHAASIEADAPHRFRDDDVAVLIPAHNEAAVLEHTLRAANTLFPVSNIHVISDGSTDHTAQIGRDFGVRVLELSPNRGKAGALLAAIQHFELARDFRIVLLLDADTRLDRDYLKTGLPEFDDPSVVAVAGSVRCLLDPPPRTLVGRLLISYRARLYVMMQYLNKYGQSARWANVMPIIPGFASMYRADVLDRIDIAAPGLAIEDFNMTFEVHAKRLGRIAFHPNIALAYTQDPDTVGEYVRQIRRWSLGYWQTVRLHRFRFGWFRVALAAQIAELISSSVLLLLSVPLMLFSVYSETLARSYGSPDFLGEELVGTLRPQDIAIGVLVPDLVVTAFAVIVLRRPSLLLLAPFLPVLRFVDAYVSLRSIPTALRTRSNGRWISPIRRGVEPPTVGGPTPTSLPRQPHPAVSDPTARDTVSASADLLEGVPNCES